MVIDDMITDMVNDKMLESIVIRLFIRGMKLIFSLIFTTQSFFPDPKMLD